MVARTPKKPAPDDDDTPVGIDDSPQIKTRSILKKKDFLDRAVDRSGVKKADAKAVVEATLAVLAEALATGEDLVLPPLGKLKVARQRDHPRGRILMIRLQMTPEGPSGTEPLAEAAD